ncbi:N-acyl-D-amino-acid deacylase family protein [Amphiplicatus metriothermophilus]|uniref:N-acyl-D-aspartate/D-glutamate deacylase n=1 Tax=Amphiplicatus metriothermophilus TaxID=1519374 RepID=A0A239PJT8_9PROT|nr:amidohydrolase family protein [Amphiplicatus metriothermophilus]MBB5517595.1 N-acyl-D-aspartate/D-glutamate deacylase [Amphiplicatus metriothermophilus]SNT68071.1 N-acyl-D-aspartate/D-glutamate deacylase [Amphiplicatus metriothermophilus]
MAAFDLLIKRAKIFDGHGGDPVVGDVALKDGHVSARGRNLPDDIADEVIDAEGLWLMPGLLDIHTHYDLEVELSPGLPESVRHGTTTAVVSNCSLGLAFGNLRRNGEDPVVDCFARVENVPKPVLARVAERASWTDSKDYLDHLDSLNLGPNIVPMIPYSMLRIAAMGTNAAVTRPAEAGEIAQMERLLEKGMREGYVGFSTDGLPFHYLANDPNRDKKIPSQYASFAELKRLLSIVRSYGRVWQATPPTENPWKVFRAFLLTSGRLYGKPLKTTAVAALDLRSNRNVIRSAYLLSRLLNSKLLDGRFALQTLAARFKVWADGPITPLAEEIPVLRELMTPDLEDRAGRQRLYDDPEYEARFKAMWRTGKTGFNPARLKRLLRLEDMALRRELSEMVVESCPVPSWAGESFAAIFARLKRFQETGKGARDGEEQAVFERFPPVADDADFVFHLLKMWDRELYWWTISANADEKRLRQLTMDPLFLPGFSDSGAHLTNLAFYDVNLRALKIAMEEKGEPGVAWMVRRLTRDPAMLFNIEAGSIDPGDQADVVLIDPKALARYDGEAATRRIWRETLQNDQLVNRSDGVVTHVFIRGRAVWKDGAFTPAFEREKLGRVLKARNAAGA